MSKNLTIAARRKADQPMFGVWINPTPAHPEPKVSLVRDVKDEAEPFLVFCHGVGWGVTDWATFRGVTLDVWAPAYEPWHGDGFHGRLPVSALRIEDDDGRLISLGAPQRIAA